MNTVMLEKFFEKKFFDTILAVRGEKSAMGPRPYKGIGGCPSIRRLQTDGQFGSLDDLAPLHMSSISTGANN